MNENRLMKALLAVSMLALMTFPAGAQALDYTYTTNNGSITITGYTGSGGDVTIPSTINGLPVTTIGHGKGMLFGPIAFNACSNLTSVIIPETVTFIGAGEFINCPNLTNVTIPASVTNIGRSAFVACTGLTTVIIPNSVATIGESAFAACTSLTAITVNANNPVYSSVDGVLLNQDQTTLIQYPGGKLGSYTIPVGITAIKSHAFYGCYGLSSIVIPDSVTNIGDYAFSYCPNLTSITIPDSVTNIARGAFYHCSRLPTIMIPASVTSIGRSAFRDCDDLKEIYFLGDAPNLDPNVFDTGRSWEKATIYYTSGTTGWGDTFGDLSTALWDPGSEAVASNDFAQILAERAAQYPFPPVPSLKLEQAVQIAKSYLKEKKVDTSNHYLDNVRLLQRSSWVDGKHWIIVWKLNVFTHGGEIFVFVGMDESVRQVGGI